MNECKGEGVVKMFVIQCAGLLVQFKIKGHILNGSGNGSAG